MRSRAMATGGNSHQRKVFEDRVRREVESRLAGDAVQKSTPAASVTENKTTWQRFLEFIEHPLFTLSIGIVGGIVGVFLYAPLFVVCGLCVVLAFHRARVVVGKSQWVVLPSYAVLCGLVIGTFWGLYIVVNRKLAESNTSFSQLVATAVIKLLPKTEQKPTPVQSPPKTTPPTTLTVVLPCENSMAFSQEQTIDYVIEPTYIEKVTVHPKRFKPSVMPYILFRATARITGGMGQGVLVKEHMHDPVTAGLDMHVGQMGFVARGNNYGELWLADQEKFVQAKAVDVWLYAASPFKVECVQWPPQIPTESEIIPKAQ
jgi:hypothetical protein